MAISNNIANNGKLQTIYTYGLLSTERVNCFFYAPSVTSGCVYTNQVKITGLATGSGATLKKNSNVSVVLNEVLDTTTNQLYFEIVSPAFNQQYSFQFQYIGTCGESVAANYTIEFKIKDGISVGSIHLPNLAKGEIVADIQFEAPVIDGDCAFSSYQFLSLPPTNKGVLKKNGTAITLATTFLDSDTISLEIPASAPLGSVVLSYKANGACTDSYPNEFVYFIDDAPALPTMITQAELYVGETIRGSVQANGFLVVYRDSAQIQEIEVLAGNWSYIPTVDGIYSFRLRNKFGLSQSSISTNVIDPSKVIPPAPFVSTITPTSINVPISLICKSNGTLKVFKDGSTTPLTTKNVVFGENTYTATAAGAYQFSLQNAIGESPLSSQIVVNSNEQTQKPTINFSGSDLQLPSSYIRIICPVAGTLRIYNALNVQVSGNITVTAGQSYDYAITDAGVYYATLQASLKNESQKSDTVEVLGVVVAKPIINNSIKNVELGTIVNITVAANGTLIPYRNGNIQTGISVTAGNVDYTPTLTGAYNFKLQTVSGISDFSETITVLSSISGLTVRFVGAVSSCGDTLEYGYHASSQNPEDVANWSSSNIISVPSEGEYYFFVRSASDHSIYWVRFLNTGSMEIYNGDGSNNSDCMKTYSTTVNLVESLPKQINFEAGQEIQSYMIELRDANGNLVIAKIPNETKTPTGFIISPDISVNSCKVLVIGV